MTLESFKTIIDYLIITRAPTMQTLTMSRDQADEYFDWIKPLGATSVGAIETESNPYFMVIVYMGFTFRVKEIIWTNVITGEKHTDEQMKRMAGSSPQ